MNTPNVCFSMTSSHIVCGEGDFSQVFNQNIFEIRSNIIY